LLELGAVRVAAAGVVAPAATAATVEVAGTATGGQGQGEGRDARDPRGRPAPDRPTHRVSLVTWAGTHHDSDVGTGGLLWSALLKPPGGRKSTGSRGKPVTIRQHLRTVARHRGSAPTR